MAWKAVERTIIVLGFIIAAATLYYTAAAYYESSHPTWSGGMSAPWWVFAGGFLGVALLITGWAMMIVRSNKPRAIRTDLQLQFHANNLNPTCLAIHNIATWYSMRHAILINEMPSPSFPTGRQYEHRFWTLHIVFDRPVNFKQITFNTHGVQIPAIEVKDRNTRHAVILISGDMPAVIMDMECVL